MANVVYWERQDPMSKLCALHCLNSFLQGPYVTNIELEEISRMLDQKESELLNTSGSLDLMDPEVIAAGRLDNGNILGYRNDSDGGNFNITVLVEAFRRRNLRCDYCSMSNLNLNLFQRNDNVGFICNVQEHWFCIRKLMTDRWFILDSLRQGPQEKEYGELYSFISTVLETNKGIVFLVYPEPSTGKLPVADPKKFTKLESNQFFLNLEQIKEMNSKENGDDDEKKDFLFRAGETKRKRVEWPKTGGIRLNDSTVPSVSIIDPVKADDEEYNESDSRTVAVKLGGTTRITRRFSPMDHIDDVFTWVEKNIKTSNAAFYTLVQMAPSRRFVKYLSGCVEMVDNNQTPKDVTGASLNEVGFESQEMFILRCE